MKELFTVTFECEVLTPMFLGSSDPRDAELRPPSIKGAIRFWWRAMNGGMNLTEMHEDEKNIFGGIPDSSDTEDAKKIGKSKVLISVSHKIGEPTNERLSEHITIETFDAEGKPRKLDSILFLGFGKGLPRSKKENRAATEWANYINCGEKFIVTLSSKNLDVLKEASESFRIMAHFGGLGGKSRNGFGSFRITKIGSDGTDFKQVEFKKLLTGNELPSYPAFSQFTKLIAGKTGFRTWDQAMDHLAQTYYSAKQKLTRSEQIPDSGTFGNKKEFAGMLLKNTGVHLPKRPNRIPKPFFMKITKDINGTYGWQILYLPSRFLEGLREENPENTDAMQEEYKAYMELMVDKLENWNKEETL